MRAQQLEGVPVSKEEVIAKLGHLRNSYRDSLRNEFRKHLKPGATKLDLLGLIGSSGEGYYQLLQNLYRNLPGCGTDLVSDEEDAEIFKWAHEYLNAEMRRCEIQVNKLKRSPEAIAQYILDLVRHIRLQKSILKMTRDWSRNEKNVTELDDAKFAEFQKQDIDQQRKRTRRTKLVLHQYILLLDELIKKQ